MVRRVDKSDRTTFMQKNEINGIALENDPLLQNGRAFSTYITRYKNHVVTNYDRLDLLAYKYYNNPAYWWLILLANDMIDERALIEGITIKLPSLQDYQSFLNDFTT